MSDAQIQKQDLWWWKIRKPVKFQNCPKKLSPQWFGHKISEPIDFHDNVVIIQHKLMIFSKKKLGSELTLRWSDTPWCIFDILSSFWVHWDTLVHWPIISRSYRLQHLFCRHNLSYHTYINTYIHTYIVCECDAPELASMVVWLGLESWAKFTCLSGLVYFFHI